MVKSLPPEMVVFRDNMVSVREALKLTQADLARRCGCKPQNICDIETGRRQGLSLATASKIAQALEVPLALLVSRRKHTEFVKRFREADA
jgi:transcriptional regulator with XRE-family HTH domain